MWFKWPLYINQNKNSIWKPKDVGLYRDDGLEILQNLSGPQMERVRKEIIKIFKELLRTTKTNLKVAQFLDIELDLINNTYRTYKKLDVNPMYINVNSNIPPSIIKQIPESINRRFIIKWRSLFKQYLAISRNVNKEWFSGWIDLYWTKNFRRK